MTATRDDIDYIFKVIDDITTALDDLEFTPQVDRAMDFVEEGRLHKVVLDLLDIKRDLCKRHEKLGVWF